MTLKNKEVDFSAKWTSVALLVFLILSTPFLKFLDYNSYNITAPEVLIGLVGMTIIALLYSGLTMIGGRFHEKLIDCESSHLICRHSVRVDGRQ